MSENNSEYRPPIKWEYSRRNQSNQNSMNETTETVPHLCPVCSGNGIVSPGFYATVTGLHAGTSASPEPCRSCNGSGVIMGSITTRSIAEPIVEAPEPKQEEFKPWRPEGGQYYFIVNELFEVVRYRWKDTQPIKYHECVNKYETEVRAKAEAEYWKTLCELRAWSDGLDGFFTIDPIGDAGYCVIRFDPSLKSQKTSSVKFASEKQAYRAIRHFGNRLDVIYR